MRCIAFHDSFVSGELFHEERAAHPRILSYFQEVKSEDCQGNSECSKPQELVIVNFVFAISGAATSCQALQAWNQLPSTPRIIVPTLVPYQLSLLPGTYT